jgi:hypothetical protein
MSYSTFGNNFRYSGDLRSTGILGLNNPIAGGDISHLGDNATNHTIVKALLKAKDMKINIAQAIAESNQTLGLIGDSVMRLYKGYRAARKGDFRTAAKELGVTFGHRGRKVANNWLELQYGWLPLLSDIQGAYDEITRPARVNGYRFKVTSSTKESSKSETFAEMRNTLDTCAISSDIKKAIKVSLSYEVTSEALLLASQTGLTNLSTVVWELTPWSFVVDWFLPVGNVIEAMSATQGLQFIGGTVTSTVRSSHDNEYIANDSGKSGKGKGQYRQFSMNRSTYNASPTPTFYVKNPFSTAHALNAIALLRTLR